MQKVHCISVAVQLPKKEAMPRPQLVNSKTHRVAVTHRGWCVGSGGNMKIWKYGNMGMLRERAGCGGASPCGPLKEMRRLAASSTRRPVNSKTRATKVPNSFGRKAD